VIVDANSVLQTWFGDDLESPLEVEMRARLWFAPDPLFDDLIRERFATLPDRALAGELSQWTGTARSCLALILVLDQFPRNLYRGSAQSFAYDSAALDISRDALALNMDRQLHPLEAVFLYMPLEHAEDRGSQEQCVSVFRKLAAEAPARLSDQFDSFVAYAERHQTVIEEFGRVPHRNSALGRASTPAELDYLRSGGETFSGSGDAT
jgi:uncharacterized protein (DUF924 family)